MSYVDGGVSGLIIENHGDIPFRKPDRIGHEITTGLAIITDRIRQRSMSPHRHQCPWPTPPCRRWPSPRRPGRISCARPANGPTPMSPMRASSRASAAAALRYRKAIGAEDVAVFADAHVKRSAHAIVADRPVAELVRDVEFFDADAVICTGQRTGDAAAVDEIEAMRAATGLPLLVGSGAYARQRHPPPSCRCSDLA